MQETLEKAIAEITREERVRVNASGRTDAGVHAVGQVVNVYTATKLELRDAAEGDQREAAGRRVRRGRATRCRRASARTRTRCGRCTATSSTTAGCTTRSCGSTPGSCGRPLDAEAMRRASRCLVGRHDFRCFETEWPNRLTSVRTITHLAVNRFGEFIWIDVEADGFLYNMVRAIAGTLVQVGRGYWPEAQIAEVLDAMDRRLAGPTAPPEGLFLMRVTYPTAAAVATRDRLTPAELDDHPAGEAAVPRP